MKTQNQLILEHLQAGNTITQKRAYQRPFYCTRLAARICDLRRSGNEITTETIKRRTPRTGKRIAFARYRMDV